MMMMTKKRLHGLKCRSVVVLFVKMLGRLEAYPTSYMTNLEVAAGDVALSTRSNGVVRCLRLCLSMSLCRLV